MITAGEKYHYLIAIKFDHRTKKNCFWRFKCICGKEPIIRRSSVIKGETKSCGCMKAEILKNREPTWSKPEGVAARNALLNSYKHNAKKRELEYQLTDEEFNSITSSNCFYCGVEPRQKVSNKFNKRNGTYVYNGLDRIDNTRGYVVSNCVACCGICNRAKNNLSTQEFQTWLSRLVKFQRNKK